MVVEEVGEVPLDPPKVVEVDDVDDEEVDVPLRGGVDTVEAAPVDELISMEASASNGAVGTSLTLDAAAPTTCHAVSVTTAATTVQPAT